MNITLSNTRLFRGIGSDELPLLLQCLGAVQKHYDRGETILAEGADRAARHGALRHGHDRL